MDLDSKIWGPHYWIFLHTIALTYPLHPTTVVKKKYYDFVQNIPLFIPIKTMASNFSKLINEYPVTPYLDSRDSFVKWMNFIHNKINTQLEKPHYSLNHFYNKFYKNKKVENYLWREKVIYIILIILIIGFIIYLYNI
jgi:hypothetical protein